MALCVHEGLTMESGHFQRAKTVHHVLVVISVGKLVQQQKLDPAKKVAVVTIMFLNQLHKYYGGS